MKKVIFIVVILSITLAVKAQHRIESPHPDLKVEVKRAAVSSGKAVVDLLITNLGSEETIRFITQRVGNDVSLAYDDEGNQYPMLLGIPSKGLSRYTYAVFPKNVPLRFRLQMSDVDANASKFIMIKVFVESNGPMGLNNKSAIVIHNLDLAK